MRVLLLACVALVVVTLSGAAIPPRPGQAANAPPSANVRGTVWLDQSGLGRRQGSEPVAPYARISISPDPGGAPVFANGGGAFAFSVPEGVYTIEVSWDGPLGQPHSSPSDSYYFATTRHLMGGVSYQIDAGLRPNQRFPSQIDGKIEVVWPRDLAGSPAPLTEAPLANVAAYLFHSGTHLSVPCGYSPRLELVAAVDDRPGNVVAVGQRRIAKMSGRTFPTWQFDAVDVSPALKPGSRVYLWLRLEEAAAEAASRAAPRFRSNVWTHSIGGADAPRSRVEPSATRATDSVDAKIDVVWPHDANGRERPVTQANIANVDVLLVDAADPSVSVPPELDVPVWLEKSFNGQPAEILPGRRVVVGHHDPAYPKWLFEDVDVSAARNPANRYYFRAIVGGVGGSSSVWVHGADDRTFAPDTDLPEGTPLDCQ